MFRPMDAQDNSVDLTDKQRRILQLVGAGESVKEIAATLGVHENTVKFHEKALRVKLGVPNRRNLAAVARDHA
jgi:DNA-binding CsgD family transcriptional regulator